MESNKIYNSSYKKKSNQYFQRDSRNCLIYKLKQGSYEKEATMFHTQEKFFGIKHKNVKIW